jgi:hypothetical protein
LLWGCGAMLVDLDAELFTERLHALVACADPLAAKLTDERRILFEPVREHAPARALQSIGGGQPRKARADDYSRVRAEIEELLSSGTPSVAATSLRKKSRRLLIDS